MDGNLNVSIQPISNRDSRWIKDLIVKRWGSIKVVSRGVIRDVLHLPGYIAWSEDIRVGLLTYTITDNKIEIVTLDSLLTNAGIGTALILQMQKHAKKVGCRKIWLITTNDNLDALRFYQLRGFHIKAFHRNALEYSRRLKPEIPETGLYGIPIRDEIELELILNS
jgi:GNAT superfamily N-acetyltransferase